MLTTYAVGTIGIVLLGLLWVAVQRAWSRVFPDAFADPDVLAERIGCHGCGRNDTCRRRCAERAASAGEGMS